MDAATITPDSPVNAQRSAHVFNNIKMEQLLRVLKQEYPNAAGGHNAPGEPQPTR